MAATKGGWDLEVDLVCVGSGMGGLSAAVAAYDAGLQVLVLEKAKKVGGVTAYSHGQIWCGANHLQDSAGYPRDSLAATREYLQYVSGGQYEAANLEALVVNSPLVIRYFMERAGVRIKIISNFSDYYFPGAPGSVAGGRVLEVEPFPGAELGEWQHLTRTSPHVPAGLIHDEVFAWGGLASMQTWDAGVMAERIQNDMRTFGPGLAAYFVKAALVDRGIPCHTETAGSQLVTEDGAVIGIRATPPRGGELLIRARRGVVLATSGYDGNREYARRFERRPEWNTATFPGLDGDGLTMGAEIGAAVVGVAQDQVYPGFATPGETHDGVPLFRMGTGEMGLPHGIVVNQDGRRFADEAFYPDVLAALQHFDAKRRRLKNFPVYLICDHDYRERYPLGSVLPGVPLPDGFGVTADTVAGVADALQIDATTLEKTVERFNGFARAGKDLDFGRGGFAWSQQMFGDPRAQPNANLGPLERPPFYGVRLEMVAGSINNAGLLTDAAANVRHVRGHAIPGLYAVGNAAPYVELGRGYQSGLSNARGMVFGYLAAQHAAKRSVDADRPAQMV